MLAHLFRNRPKNIFEFFEIIFTEQNKSTLVILFSFFTKLHGLKINNTYVPFWRIFSSTNVMYVFRVNWFFEILGATLLFNQYLTEQLLWNGSSSWKSCYGKACFKMTSLVQSQKVDSFIFNRKLEVKYCTRFARKVLSEA